MKNNIVNAQAWTDAGQDKYNWCSETHGDDDDEDDDHDSWASWKNKNAVQYNWRTNKDCDKDDSWCSWKKDYPLMGQWWTVAGQDSWSIHTQHSENTRRKRNLPDAPTCSNDKEDSKKLHSSTRVWGPAPPITPPPPHLQLPMIKKPRQSALATALCDQLECALAEPGAYVVGRAS